MPSRPGAVGVAFAGTVSPMTAIPAIAAATAVLVSVPLSPTVINMLAVLAGRLALFHTASESRCLA